MIDISDPTVEQTSTIKIYHIEDESDWVEIIRDLIGQKRGEFSYEHISSSSGAFRTLARIRGPGIILWDLRLDGENTEYQTALELSKKLLALRRRGFEIFVVSGFLHGTTRSLLSRVGIPDSHIFEKGRKFSGKDFIRRIRQAKSSLTEKLSIQEEEPSFQQSSKLEITAKFVGLDDVDEPLLVIGGKRYQFSISAIPLRNQRPNKNQNETIDIAICCAKARISPQILVFDILQPDEKVADVSFDYDSELEAGNFYAIIFHDNHLVRLVVFHLKVLNR